MESARPMTSCVETHATLGTQTPSPHTSSVERLDLVSLTLMLAMMVVATVNSTAGSLAGVSSCHSLAMASVHFRQFQMTLGRGSIVQGQEHAKLGNRLVMELV